MIKTFKPKGRSNLPKELLNFGRNLVYSEGTTSEPNYVENIKESISTKYKCNPNIIDIIPVDKGKKSYNTIGLVNHAIDDVNKRLENGEIINNVWIFFDKDEFPVNDYKKAIHQIEKLNNSNDENENGFKYQKETEIAWHACWSNEAFELWYCLYFDFDEASHKRSEYTNILNNKPQLKKIGFVYSKSTKNMHTILTNAGGSINKAIKFAKSLEKSNSYENPSTGVYKFAEFFLPYMNTDYNNY